MTTLVIEIILILLLLFANGVFVMTEMAVVSARKGKSWTASGLTRCW